MLPLRLSEIAKLVGGEMEGLTDPVITGVAGLSEAGPSDLSFVAGAKHLTPARDSAAGALLVAREMAWEGTCVRVDHPYRAFAQILALVQLDLDRVFPPGLHATAAIDPTADVSLAAAVGPFCVVGAGSVVGEGTRLGSHVSVGVDVTIGRDGVVYPQVVIREGCRLGDRVIVHAGCVVGSDGFGYLPSEQGLHKIPQIGIVEIADDVELGAGVTIDRATTGRTVIGAGTKLDNQVQIGHNVQVGRHCALSAQSGVAGSSVLGDAVVFGGQVGVGDHVKVGAGSQVGGQSGVTRDLPAGSRAFGTPAVDAKRSFRQSAALGHLPALLAEVRQLKAMVADLQARLAAVRETPENYLDDGEN